MLQNIWLKRSLSIGYGVLALLLITSINRPYAHEMLATEIMMNDRAASALDVLAEAPVLVLTAFVVMLLPSLFAGFAATATAPEPHWLPNAIVLPLALLGILAVTLFMDAAFDAGWLVLQLAAIPIGIGGGHLGAAYLFLRDT